jgi:hypothetical protein
LADPVSIVISGFMSTVIFIVGLLIGTWQNKIMLHTNATKMLKVLKLQNQPDFEYLDYDVKKGDFVYMRKTESTTNQQE